MNAKLAELLALAPDVTWSAGFSDRRDHVAVYAKSRRLPGAAGLDIELQAPLTWRVRPATSSLRQDEAAFWQRFSVRDGDPFAGFDLTMTDLAAVLPAPQLAIVLDGLRSIAARREAAAFENSAAARRFRAVVRQYDRGWACPALVAPGQFEDSGHCLRVERLWQRDRHEWRPAGCWALRQVAPRPRSWLLPGWWATRRGADDEARRLLTRNTIPDAGPRRA